MNPLTPFTSATIDFTGMSKNLIHKFALIQMNAWKEFANAVEGELNINVQEQPQPQTQAEQPQTPQTQPHPEPVPEPVLPSDKGKSKAGKKSKTKETADNTSDTASTAGSSSSSGGEKKKRGASEYNKFISRELERAKHEPGFNHKTAFADAVKKWKTRVLDGEGTSSSDSGFGTMTQADAFGI